MTHEGSKTPKEKLSLTVVMTELMLASWETIVRRTLLMIQNDCSPGEYQRMVKEGRSSGGPRRALDPAPAEHRCRHWFRRGARGRRPMLDVCGKSSTGNPAGFNSRRPNGNAMGPRFCHISAVCFYHGPGDKAVPGARICPKCWEISVPHPVSIRAAKG